MHQPLSDGAVRAITQAAQRYTQACAPLFATTPLLIAHPKARSIPAIPSVLVMRSQSGPSQIHSWMETHKDLLALSAHQMIPLRAAAKQACAAWTTLTDTLAAHAPLIARLPASCVALHRVHEGVVDAQPHWDLHIGACNEATKTEAAFVQSLLALTAKACLHAADGGPFGPPD